MRRNTHGAPLPKARGFQNPKARALRPRARARDRHMRMHSRAEPCPPARWRLNAFLIKMRRALGPRPPARPQPPVFGGLSAFATPAAATAQGPAKNHPAHWNPHSDFRAMFRAPAALRPHAPAALPGPSPTTRTLHRESAVHVCASTISTTLKHVGSSDEFYDSRFSH